MKKTQSHNLLKAKRDKKDEFYTQLIDIENEMQYYTHEFENKVIFMNADNPKFSQFWKYFKTNFKKLKLKSIISTFYSKDGDSFKTTYNGEKEVNVKLQGDGDFRSQEVVEILKDIDIVVTNPPFSLFSAFINQLHEHNKSFIIVGNQNAITQKLMFKLLKENKVWLGKGFPGNVGYFYNDIYENYAVAGGKIEGMIRVSGVVWYTNVPSTYKRKPFLLTENYDKDVYPKYDNYNAINVDRVNKIPKDYPDEMGVPITFMLKYVPEQFDIIGLDTYLFDTGGTRFKLNGKTKYARIIIKIKV